MYYNLIIVISNDYNIALFRIDKNNNNYEISFISRLVGHLNVILTAYYSKDLDLLISVDDKMFIRFWDLEK